MGFDLRAQDLALLHRRLNELRQESVVLEPAPCGHCLAEWAYWGHREGPENALAAETVRASERHWVCKGLQADHAAQLAQEFVKAPERVEVCGYSRADRHRAAQASPSRAGAGLAQRAKLAPRCTGEAFAGVSDSRSLLASSLLAGRIRLTARPRGPSSIAIDNPRLPRCLDCGSNAGFRKKQNLISRSPTFTATTLSPRGYRRGCCPRGPYSHVVGLRVSAGNVRAWTRRAGDVLAHTAARTMSTAPVKNTAQPLNKHYNGQGCVVSPARRTPMPLTHLTVAGSFTPVRTCHWRTRRSWPGLRRDGTSTWTLGPRGRTRRRARPKRRSPWSGRSMRVAIPWRRRWMRRHLPRSSARQRRPRLKMPEDGPVNE